MGQGIDPPPCGKLFGDIEHQLGVHDGHMGGEGVVGQGVLHASLLVGHHREGSDLGAGSRGGGDADHLGLLAEGRHVVHPLADVHEAHGQPLKLGIRHLVHQPHDLGSVHRGATTQRNDDVRFELQDLLQPLPDAGQGGVGGHVVEDLVVHVVHVQDAGDLVSHAHVVEGLVGHHEGTLLALELSQGNLQATALEVHLGGHPEPKHVLTALSHVLDVEQLAGAHVGGDRGGAPGATAQGEGGVQMKVVQVPNGTLGRGGVDQDTHGLDNLAKVVDGSLVEGVGVKDRGMARATKGDELVSHVHSLLKARGFVHGQHRAQLLLRKGLLVTDLRHLADDDLGAGGDGDAKQLGQLADALAHDVRVQLAVNDDLGAHLDLLLLGQEVCAAALELLPHSVIHLVHHNHGLL
mmetsp:Transcript_27186/g.59356  ORF Transcript_27186/g.59356 Transcript_27186/m.59356 type:complete len:407 (-) Transcript_27186:1092-2312(-)